MMKLSEAIRFGEFALQPIHGHWMTFDEAGQPCGGCAVGRTVYAVGYRGSDDSLAPMHKFAKQMWPWISTNDFNAPCGCLTEDPQLLLGEMSHLYEYHNWTMTQIADWVATVEPQDAPVPVPVEQAENVEPHYA